MDKNVIEWHRYPENKPEEEGRYFLTFLNPENSELWVEGYTYHASDEGVLPENDGYDHYVNVKAWAKYPEPYKGDGSSSDDAWSPYPEETPEGGTVCIVTYESNESSRLIREDIFIDEENLVGFESNIPARDRDVAWMQYPKPYQESSNEGEQVPSRNEQV